jgi:hypothetical protein
LAPAGPFAADAFATLEREIFAAYEGSDIEELPEEDAQVLRALRELVDHAESS